MKQRFPRAIVVPLERAITQPEILKSFYRANDNQMKESFERSSANFKNYNNQK